MSQSLEIDVDQLMEQIRATRVTGVLAAPQPETTLVPSVYQEVADLTALHSNYDVYHVDFHSHRKVLGYVVVRLKQALRQLLTPILERQCAFNAASVRMTTSHQDQVMHLRELTGHLQEQKTSLQQQVTHLQQQVTPLQQQVTHLQQQLQVINEQHHAVVAALRQDSEALAQRQEVSLQTLRTEYLAQVQSLKQEVERGLDERSAQQHSLEQHFAQWAQTLSRLKSDHILQERRLTVLLEEARKRLPAPLDQTQLQAFANEDQHMLDALYASFEDQFRGTRQEIGERFEVYLPLLKAAGLGSQRMPILDVGCGRGEWLELLREEGMQAQGVDENRLMIAECRTRGLTVIDQEAVTYLATLQSNSLGGVTGFHVIEHLPFDVLIKLLDETVRVLKPGGIAIFETPNPENILVGSLSFYLDPTHRNPLPSSMIKFLAEARGLCRVEIMPLHPYPESYHVDGGGLEMAQRFNTYFYGPQDYAVVGWKV